MSDVTIRPFQQTDHDDWRRLWTAYLEFYKTTVPEEVYQTTWKRLFTDGEFEPKGFLALIDGKPVGLVHYLYHRSGWSIVNNCYLHIGQWYYPYFNYGGYYYPDYCSPYMYYNGGYTPCYGAQVPYVGPNAIPYAEAEVVQY